MMTKEFIAIRNEIKNRSSKQLINDIEVFLDQIKKDLMITKMIVLELQVRKEEQNGK